MYCGSSWRPPRRTAIAGRLVLLCSLIVVFLGASAGPAAAYSCGSASQDRTLAGPVVGKKDCEEEPARRVKRGNADPMSFMFFIGIMVAVVFVPVALNKRGLGPPE